MEAVIKTGLGPSRPTLDDGEIHHITYRWDIPLRISFFMIDGVEANPMTSQEIGFLQAVYFCYGHLMGKAGTILMDGSVHDRFEGPGGQLFGLADVKRLGTASGAMKGER